jgi:hypothetical protein
LTATNARAHRPIAMRPISLALPAVLALAGCAYHPGREFAAQAPAFDAAVFFAGETEGVGTLHRVLSRPRTMVVRSRGRYVEGRLLLTQRILIQDQQPTRRTFDLHRVAPGQWRGTLSDSSGPVTAVSEGNALHVRFKTASGFSVDQRLYLAANGRTAQNRTVITRFGTDWARIDETIRHLD